MTDSSNLEPSKPQSLIPDPNSSAFLGMGNTDLALIRTDFASDRTDMAGTRTDLARDRNRLAAERTLMAWIRTSLSMISFGFGIDRFFAYLKRAEVGTGVNRISEERILGLALITLGVLALLAAIVVHWRTLKDLESKKFKYRPGWSLGITVAIVLVFIGLASYIPLITQDINIVELISLDSQIVQNLAALAVFSIMLTLGVELPLAKLLDFWKKPGLVGRSLLAVMILPIIVVALCLAVFPFPQPLAIGLILLIASPGPALLTRRAGMAGARQEFALSLQVSLALLAIVLTPLTLKVFSLLFPTDQATINTLLVAKQVAIVQFLPLSIGLLIRFISKDLATDINSFLKTIANTLFFVLAVLLLVVSLDVIPKLGLAPIAFLVILTCVGLAIGHLIGSSEEPDIQAGIAITVIARNVGLAIFIATVNGQSQLIPTIIGALVIGLIVGLPYSIWMKRQIAQSGVSQTPAPSA